MREEEWGEAEGVDGGGGARGDLSRKEGGERGERPDVSSGGREARSEDGREGGRGGVRRRGEEGGIREREVGKERMRGGKRTQKGGRERRKRGEESSRRRSRGEQAGMGGASQLKRKGGRVDTMECGGRRGRGAGEETRRIE